MDLESYMDHLEARRRVNEQVLQANTLLEVEAAKQVLRDWLKAYPEESGMRDGFEQLYTIQEIIEGEDARRASEQEHFSSSAADAVPLSLEQRSRSGAAK